MQHKKTIKMPTEIQEYLWSRYLPETTFKMYVMVGYLNAENIKGEKATNTLLNANLTVEREIPQVTEEKKRVLEKLGYKYPETRKEDIELLLKYNLVRIAADKDGNLLYLYNTPVPRPEEVLNLDEEELTILENIRFEIKHQHAFNMFLTLLLNSNGTLATTLDHIHKTTKVKYSDLKEVLEFLEKEGSINIKASKNVKNLRKNDKVYISINKEVFEQKRFVIA
ncbi:DUF6042 family protein [Tepidibacter thalassicus]|uniref:Uncharacterized protein n=1 Tax=Tepidibacter thalassicus DSM 15285 TaxID=1123350 RepID=A0A1M5S5B3_9FIRM|nr:DUF6042 family protein [Tepidibacter thalassicus]SHH33787.1 hypothetical protein SAMN02744040_01639 [Tepidibacter thalassicus DSM 15285]